MLVLRMFYINGKLNLNFKIIFDNLYSEKCSGVDLKCISTIKHSTPATLEESQSAISDTIHNKGELQPYFTLQLLSLCDNMILAHTTSLN